jgi:hypothetical protein
MAQRLVCVFVLFATAGPACFAQGDRTALSNLSMEVTALQTIRVLRLTPDQMRTLRHWTPETAQQERIPKGVTASRDYRNLLAALHAALVDGEDDDKIDELVDQLMELREAEEPELNDAIETTDAARKRAPEVFAFLSARQLASYLGAYGEDFPDPVDLLRQALKEVHDLQGDDFTELRDNVAEQVALLIAGLDDAEARLIRLRVVKWLDEVQALSDEQFKAQKADLEAAAQRTVGKVSALRVLRNVVERDLAELLSNPRLSRALDVRLRRENKKLED